ncbi:class I SAM-dependent methyltransferase [Streptomyces sp. NPDC060194]|uniref:class I SAM-dependent methyltransferase n=1 Tax=Streptomyces sp. NPDC060194 TaxID=3347069 RepID=UPI003663E5C3
MTPMLAQRHLPRTAPPPGTDTGARARDWAEIQERMLVPLYDAVYARLEIGRGSRMLEVECGSGLALLMAAARGATVTGVEEWETERLALARERLGDDAGPPDGGARLVEGTPDDAAADGAAPYNVVTSFQPVGCLAGDSEGLAPVLASAARHTERGAPVVLAGWGPPERCATSSVLRVATKLADPMRGSGSWRPASRDDLEEVAERAGLRPDGSGRVACPFGYADIGSAVRGLLSTGLFDAAAHATDQAQVRKEVKEALHPHRRKDGTVWMPNIFRYLIARVP